MPFTYSIMVIGSLSLLATPFLTGFYSKDFIIELAYAKYSYIDIFVYCILTVTAGLTAFYSFRLIMLTFLTMPNASRSNYLHIHESNIFVLIPLVTLAFFSIFFGYLCSDLFIGIGTDVFGSSLFIYPNNIAMVEAEFSLPLIIKSLPALLSLTGIILAFIFYQLSPNFVLEFTNNAFGRKLYGFFNGKYYFDVIYNNYIIRKGLNLGYEIINILEKGFIENFGPNGLTITLYNMGKNIGKLDTGVVTSYALYIVLGLISIIFIIFSPLFFNLFVELELRLVVLYLGSILIFVNFNSFAPSLSAISNRS